MIVVDASVAVKWLYPERHEAAAQLLLESEQRLLAPALIKVEVAAALVKKARLGHLSKDEAAVILAAWFSGASRRPLVTTPDELDLPEAAKLALELGHPIYDCLYLALAIRHGIALVTADAAFAERAAARYSNVRMLA
jgi:predicted nucleic acid-binding protein